MLTRNVIPRTCRRQTQRSLVTLFVWCALFAATGARAGVYRCVGADGSNTYSDRPCTNSESDPSGQPRPPAASAQEQQISSGKLKKAVRILDLLRIAPSEPETFVLQRTVDDSAPDLVQALDPDSRTWTPANAKWHGVLEFVKADLRRDVQTSLRASTTEISRVTAQQFSSRADEADLDAVLVFLGSGDGSRYIAVQNEVRHILYEALASLLAQESVPEEPPSDASLRLRQDLLYLTLDYRIQKDGGGPVSSRLDAGSAAVVEYSARHDGAALDALIYEYEPELPKFRAFNESPTGKRLFHALEPAVRTYTALSSTATTNFAEIELDKYFFRWRAMYGPPVRSVVRTSVMIRGRMVMISQTSQATVNVGGSPEGMAIACEQREDNLYQNTHRNAPDNNAQAAALKAIQNRCRAEQRLPSL